MSHGRIEVPLVREVTEERAAFESGRELTQAAMAARRYFLDGVNKSQIADELGVSRFKVARLIQLARDEGIVTFRISFPFDVNLELSTAVQTHYALSSAWVVGASPLLEQASKAVARCAARILAEALGDDDVLGFAWGRTMAEVANELPDLPACDVVQTAGGIGGQYLDSDAVELARDVARRTGGRAYLLHAPLLVDDEATAERLRADRTISETIAKFNKLTKFVTGIGAWTTEGSSIEAIIPDDDRVRLDARGVVADVGLCLLDADGSIVSDDLSARSFAITSDQIAKTPYVLAVATGERKARAVNAALRSGLISHIVVDHDLGKALMAL